MTPLCSLEFILEHHCPSLIEAFEPVMIPPRFQEHTARTKLDGKKGIGIKSESSVWAYAAKGSIQPELRNFAATIPHRGASITSKTWLTKSAKEIANIFKQQVYSA